MVSTRPEGERNINYVERVALDVFRRSSVPDFSGVFLQNCLGSPDVHTSPTSLLHPQRNLHKTCSLLNCWTLWQRIQNVAPSPS